MIFFAFTPLLEFFILCETNWASPESKTTSLTRVAYQNRGFALHPLPLWNRKCDICFLSPLPSEQRFLSGMAFSIHSRKPKTRLTARQMKGWRMVFASISEHAEHCDFFASTSRNKKICFASSEQFREYNSRAASTSSIFRLQQSIWKSFSLK